MNEDIVVPGLFFFTVIVLSLGIPLVRAYVRRQDAVPRAVPLSPELAARLDRLESIVETVSIEVERMAEGQRFTTRLLSEGAAQAVSVRGAQSAAKVASEVTHA
jgi:hypothetical protein